MASFVESAELRIVDNSTRQLQKIQGELRRFGADARRLQSDLSKFRGLNLAAMGASKGGNVLANSLRQQVAAAKSASSALNGLGSAYGRAAAGADRLTTSTQRAIRNMQTLTAEARALKSLGNIGGRLLPRAGGAGGNGGGRGGWGPPGGGGHGGNGGFPALPPPGHNPRKPKGYKAHVYENPSHAFANLGLGATFGHDLTLGQALTISAVGSVMMSAAHVVLEGALALAAMPPATDSIMRAMQLLAAKRGKTIDVEAFAKPAAAAPESEPQPEPVAPVAESAPLQGEILPPAGRRFIDL